MYSRLMVVSLLTGFALAGCDNRSPQAPPARDAATAAQSAEIGSAGQQNEAHMAAGRRVYQTMCQACHGADGRGLPGAFPPVANSDWIADNQYRLIEVVIEGLSGPIVVNGRQYNGVMPPMAYLSDVDVANVLTFVLNSWNNPGGEVQPKDVAQYRAGGATEVATEPGQFESRDTMNDNS